MQLLQEERYVGCGNYLNAVGVNPVWLLKYRVKND